ncbi:hypothetical protein [Streptomyces sp. NPDC057580]|uniref:hypothetical protein n=1 Tax=Streptomyces sp. NPDC057580 TaxID=3346173 RepID=UPI0036A23BE1
MTDRALQLLRSNRELAELAAFPFDFDLGRADHVEHVVLASGAALTPIAGNDTGGTYFVCGDPDADGPVLYASSDGMAGLIGDSVDEALDMLTGLPGWRDYVSLTPGDGEERLLAAVAETEEDIRDTFAPEIDAQRAELRSALDLPERSAAELIQRLHRCLLRTEPDFLLLNGEELLAYQRLCRHPGPPLWETVLEPGRADLELLRAAGGDRPASIGDDPVRRASVLRAAQFDRRVSDLPLLRRLLVQEADDAGPSEELRLALALVGAHGLAEDIPLLHGLRDRNEALRWGLHPWPGDAVELAQWAHELDGARFGRDLEAQSPLVWIGLARRQGRTETARAALIRLLDDTGPDADRLAALRGELELLGDFPQAARAQELWVSLQDTAWARGTGRLGLALLRRRSGDLPGAWQAVQRAAADLDGSDGDWRRRGVGHILVEEQLRITLAAAEEGLTDLARTSLAEAKVLMRRAKWQSDTGVGELVREAKWAVARLRAASD